MFGWLTAVGGYLYNLVYPQPAQGTVYGFQWQAAQGVPGAIQQVVPATAAPGLYVVFRGDHLDGMVDPFGRGPGGPGPVFAANGAAATAVTNMVTLVAHNPPPGEGGWTNPAAGRIADLGGFLAYVAFCLDLLDHTVAGNQLLTRITTSGQTVFISPALMGNQTFAASIDNAVDVLTRAARDYAQGGAVPSALINAAVLAQYGHLGVPAAQFNQLAADMNNAPLYTLFQTAAASPPTYLLNHFLYAGLPLAGADLLAWCGAGGLPAFDLAVRGMTVPGVDGVPVRDMFLLALCVALRPVVANGPGTGAGINFYTQNDNDNLIGSPDFRPPAIGLCHELMHAMHYTAGTSPGYDINHFTTTTAELMFAGIGPSATDPVSENAIRAQWPPVGLAPDASNTWAGGPLARLVYEPPPIGTTPAQMRAAMHCL